MPNTPLIACLSLSMLATACADDPAVPVGDPDTAPRAPIDRFSAAAGTLMVRDDANALPAANAPIDFDVAPFITTGLDPDGEPARYYNFDVQPTEPAAIYVLVREGEDAPVDGQLNLVDVVPGDAGYSDLWQVVMVTVDASYRANEVTSVDELLARDYELAPTTTLVNCPIVPDGSTASRRLAGGDPYLARGWYRDAVVHYFHFGEAPLVTTGSGAVPVSPIYVTFNTNPPEGGPATGFVTETGTDQTHNVIATVPGEPGYSPLWSVNIYDNAAFDGVADLASAEGAPLLAADVANVNCPVVARDGAP